MNTNTAKTTALLLAIMLANPLNAWAMQPGVNDIDENVELLIDEKEEQEDNEEEEEQKEDEEENSWNENTGDLGLLIHRLKEKILPSTACGKMCCAMVSLVLAFALFDELLSPETKEEMWQSLIDSVYQPHGEYGKSGSR
ncbi:MAG: hypothetical protein AAF471_04205 [Myxococcota bacterium]